MARHPLIVIGAALVILFFIGQFLFFPTAYLSSRFGHAIQAPVIFFRNLLTRDSLSRHLGALELENQSLRAQIEQLERDPQRITSGRTTYLRASAFSTYPLNFENSILLSVGSEQNVGVGDVVLSAPNIFTGQIVETEQTRSKVRTIFDVGWEIPVRIGEDRVDALLTGGPVPRLSLISKRKPVHQGDAVYLSGKDFPTGLMVGSVGIIEEPKESLFNEATLKVPYVLSEVIDFFILGAK